MARYPTLGRWFDLEFRLADSRLGNIPLTVSLTSRPTSETLQTLATALGLEFSQEDRIVILGPAAAAVTPSGHWSPLFIPEARHGSVSGSSVPVDCVPAARHSANHRAKMGTSSKWRCRAPLHLGRRLGRDADDASAAAPPPGVGASGARLRHARRSPPGHHCSGRSRDGV
jgi:hypothetical protein